MNRNVDRTVFPTIYSCYTYFFKIRQDEGEQQDMAIPYESQFTQENVIELSQFIQLRIRDYAEQKGMKLDMFVITVALQQAAYEITLRSLTENKEQAQAKIEQMMPIAETITKAVDEYRKEHKSHATEELLGAVFGSNILTEFYAQHRDEQIVALSKAAQDVQQDQAQAVAEVVDAEIVE